MPTWEPPREFDGFVIRSLLGRGGMGCVYLAHEISLDRPVALKLIASDDPDDAARQRFAREARAIARLQHPNIVAIYRIGEVDGRPYIAYEYVDGESLDTVPTPIPWTRALEIGLAVARGLALAHERGVLHRDVKPANVILARNGGIKLADFGLAKLVADAPPRPTSSVPPPADWDPKMTTADTARLGSGVHGALPRELNLDDGGTQSGLLMGTPNYIAPEIWRGESASTRSDVYALGLVMYEITSGALPFAGLTGRDLVDRVTRRALPPLATVRTDVPLSLAAIVDRSVDHEPARRQADGTELANDLGSVDGVLRSFQLFGARRGESDDVSLVTASLARAQNDPDALMTSFYDTLFARTPELEKLFPESLAGQKKMLAAALRLAVDNLRRPDRLLPVLEQLGWRHARHGASPRDLALFGDALLETIRQFDREYWDAATEAAWRRAYAAISEAMLLGMMAPASRVSLVG